MSRGRPEQRAVVDRLPFLVFDENRLAWSSLCKTRSTNARGHLLFVHGPAGCGKTQLCRLAAGRHESVLWRQAIELEEQFPLDPEDDLSGGMAWSFVVIEDIHELARHAAMQRRLAWLLDELMRSGATVVLTSLRSPGELTGFNARLRNRLLGATTAAVRMPGPASRQRLLEHFCTHLQLAIPMDVLRLFARRQAVSPRVLLGLLLRFDEAVRVHQRPASLEMAHAFLRHEPGDEKPGVEQIVRAVAREFGVTVADLKSAARDQVLMLPRQSAMFLIRELTGLQLAGIGKYFGNRSHSTVVHAVSRIAGLLPKNAVLRRQLNSIRAALRAQ